MDLGKYIDKGSKTTAGTQTYRLRLPGEKVKVSTNLNKLRQLRTTFLKNNPEYNLEKGPKLKDALASLKADLKNKETIEIENLEKLVQKYFKGRFKPSKQNLYSYTLYLQRKHPSVFKGTEVLSDWSEGQNFKDWLLKKVKKNKKPIVTGAKELVEKSGFDVSPASASHLIKRDPILNKKITIQLPSKGKGFYDKYHAQNKKFRDWVTDTYEKKWEDIKPGGKDSTSKRTIYKSYQTFLENKPKTNFIDVEEFGKEINENRSLIETYRRPNDQSAPGKMFKKIFGNPEIKGSRVYLRKPSATAIEKWKKFQKADNIQDEVAKDVKKLHNKYGDIIKAKDFDLDKDASIEKVMNKLKTNSPSRAANAMAILGRVYEGEKFRTLEFEDISSSSKAGQNLIKQLGSSKRESKYKNAFYNLALKEVAKFYKDKPGVGDFRTFRKNFLDKLQTIIPDHTFNINEIIPISTGKVRNVSPWSAFIDITQDKINQGPLSRYGGQLSTKIRQVEAALADPERGPAAAEELAKTLKKGQTPFKKTLKGPKFGLSQEQIKKLNFPEIVIGEEIDRKIYTQAQLDRWKEKGLDIEKFAKDRGYYFDVKKGTPFWEAKQSLDTLEDIFTNNKGNACVIFPRKAAAPGGSIKGGCGEQFRQAMQDDPNGTLKMISEMPAKGGPWSRIKTSAVNLMNKLPKGGRFGAALAAIGAVGAGTYAMMGDATADETGITDQSTMKFNETTGTFVNTETGDPETQTGILDWIADNPAKSGFAALPVMFGAGAGLAKAGLPGGRYLMGWKAVIPAMMVPEKMWQYKQGMEAGEMITDPLNALWALGLGRTKENMKYYEALAKQLGVPVNQVELGLRNLKPSQWKNLPRDMKNAIMAPASKGTNLAMGTTLRKPFLKAVDALKGQAGKKGLGALAKRGALYGAAALAAPFAAIPAGILTAGLLGADLLYGQYKDYRDGKAIIDSMRARGKISEEDAENYLSLVKQGSLPFGLGNRIFGDEEMTLRGQVLNADQQRQVLAGMEEQIDLFQDERQQVRALDRADDFDFFNEGGRVGLAGGGGMDRRGFLKWLAGMAATLGAGATGLFKSGAKKGVEQVAKEVVKEAPQMLPGGVPSWFPRAVAKIKADGKLIEMADKDYVNGDIYEILLPVQEPKYDMVAGQAKQSGFETVNKRVLLEENPVSGDIEISWDVDDFDGTMKRQINFRPGESGFQKFGVDPEHPGAWQYERVKISDPEFTYGNPDQSLPERDDFDFQDIIKDGDSVVGALENLTKTVDEKTLKEGDTAFQKKLYKDMEGEAGLLPDPEGHMTPDGWQGESTGEVIGGDVPDWVPKDTWQKKAEGGRIGYADRGLVGTPTDEVTQYDRRVYMTPTGEEVSEKSVTIPMGGMWINIPSIHNGREYGEDQLTEMILRGEIEPTTVHENREEAEMAAIERSNMMKRHKKGFNTGGEVETGAIARRQSLVPPLSGPNPQGIMGLPSDVKQVRVG